MERNLFSRICKSSWETLNRFVSTVLFCLSCTLIVQFLLLDIGASFFGLFWKISVGIASIISDQVSTLVRIAKMKLRDAIHSLFARSLQGLTKEGVLKMVEVEANAVVDGVKDAVTSPTPQQMLIDIQPENPMDMVINDLNPKREQILLNRWQGTEFPDYMQLCVQIIVKRVVQKCLILVRDTQERDELFRQQQEYN